MAQTDSSPPPERLIIEGGPDGQKIQLSYEQDHGKTLLHATLMDNAGHPVQQNNQPETIPVEVADPQKNHALLQSLIDGELIGADKKRVLFDALNSNDWQKTLKELAANGTLPRTADENITDAAKLLSWDPNEPKRGLTPDILKGLLKENGLNPNDPATAKAFRDRIALSAQNGPIPNDSSMRHTVIINDALEAAKNPGSLKAGNEDIGQFLQLTAQAATGDPKAKPQETLNLSPQDMNHLTTLLAGNPNSSQQLTDLNEQFQTVLDDKDKKYEAWNNNAARMTGDARGAEYRLLEADKIATAINEVAKENNSAPDFRQRSSQALTLLAQSAANNKNFEMARVFATANALLQPNAKGIRPIDKVTPNDATPRDPIQEEHDAQARAETAYANDPHTNAPPAPAPTQPPANNTQPSGSTPAKPAPAAPPPVPHTGIEAQDKQINEITAMLNIQDPAELKKVQDSMTALGKLSPAYLTAFHDGLKGEIDKHPDWKGKLPDSGDDRKKAIDAAEEKTEQAPVGTMTVPETGAEMPYYNDDNKGEIEKDIKVARDASTKPASAADPPQHSGKPDPKVAHSGGASHNDGGHTVHHGNHGLLRGGGKKTDPNHDLGIHYRLPKHYTTADLNKLELERIRNSNNSGAVANQSTDRTTRSNREEIARVDTYRATHPRWNMPAQPAGAPPGTAASAPIQPGTAVPPPPNTTYTPAPGTQNSMQVQPRPGSMTPGAYIGQTPSQMICAPADKFGAHACFVLKDGKYAGAITIPANAYPASPYGAAPPSAAQVGQNIGGAVVGVGRVALNTAGNLATTVVNIPVGVYNAFKPGQ